MSPFAYTDPNGITLFQRHLSAQRATFTPPTVVTKSDQDLAWDQVVDAARYLISKGAASTVPAAVDLLRTANHPTYQAWDRAVTTRTPRPSSRTVDVTKVAQDTHIRKRNAIMDQIAKRATALVRSGQAATEEEARAQLFKTDRALYNAYRDLSYAKAAVLVPAPQTAPPTPGPVLQQVQALARELVLDDAWGKYAGMDEQAMTGEVFRLYPSLWAAYRAEVAGPGEDEPAPKQREGRQGTAHSARR